MATIEPSPRSTISRAYAWATMNVPNVLTERIRSNSSRVTSSDGTGLKMPGHEHDLVRLAGAVDERRDRRVVAQVHRNRLDVAPGVGEVARDRGGLVEQEVGEDHLAGPRFGGEPAGDGLPDAASGAHHDGRHRSSPSLVRSA